MDLSELIQAAMQKTMDYINEENEKWNNAEIPDERSNAAIKIEKLGKILNHLTACVKLLST